MIIWSYLSCSTERMGGYATKLVGIVYKGGTYLNVKTQLYQFIFYLENCKPSNFRFLRILVKFAELALRNEIYAKPSFLPKAMQC